MKHTLIIPTRNRQIYAKEAVAFYLKSEREDIQVIVSDNSDNREKIYIELGQYRFDRRLIIIPSDVKILNMRENWERAILKATGEWVSVIGDDDALDPNIVYLIERIFSNIHFEKYKAITWSHINYCWDGILTDNRRPVAIIPVGKNIIRGVESMPTLKNILNWNKPLRSLGSGASLYHGAWHKDLIRKITNKNSNKLFEFDTAVDYESGYNALLNTEKFIHIERPFSILGACKESNSASMLDSEIAEKKRLDYKSEGHQQIYGFKENERFPWCLPIVISHFNEQWAESKKFKYELNRKNFVKGIELEVHNIEPKFFEVYKLEIINYLKNYGYSDLLSDFNPKPREIHNIGWNGIIDERIYMDPSHFAKGIIDFAPVAFSLLCPWQRIGQNYKIESYN